MRLRKITATVAFVLSLCAAEAAFAHDRYHGSPAFSLTVSSGEPVYFGYPQRRPIVVNNYYDDDDARYYRRGGGRHHHHHHYHHHKKHRGHHHHD
jgi:hypothetical protein